MPPIDHESIRRTDDWGRDAVPRFDYSNVEHWCAAAAKWAGEQGADHRAYAPQPGLADEEGELAARWLEWLPEDVVLLPAAAVEAIYLAFRRAYFAARVAVWFTMPASVEPFAPATPPAPPATSKPRRRKSA